MEGVEGVGVASAQDQEDLQTCLLEVEGVSDHRITVTRWLLSQSHWNTF